MFSVSYRNIGLWVMVVSLSLMLLCGCGHRESAACEDGGDTIEMRYAENIRMIRRGDVVHVELVNPWDTSKLLNTYDIEKPLSRSAVFSSVHCSLIDELGKVGCIAAVCDLEYIGVKGIHDGVRKGSVADFGKSAAPDIERVIDTNPDALLVSPFENSGGYGALEKLGIPIIECADYMETSPLGRAEWVKFYGLLFGCYDESVALFDSIECAYNGLRDKVNASDGKAENPRVITDLITGSTWYVPGANSTIGILIRDAGGDYVFADRRESGSLALSPETVFDMAQDADVWLLRYTQRTDMTCRELSAANTLYSRMNALKGRSVYGCNLEYSPFFEDTPFHPERLLMDFAAMFHPEVLPDYELRYFKKLAE